MKTASKVYRLLLTGALGLGLVAAPALASPPEGKGPQEQKPHGKQTYQQDAARNDNGGRDQHQDRRQGNERASDREHHGAPVVDEARVRLVFREHRDWIDHEEAHRSLPTGIRMNLKRGKPLPPGIARNFDPRLRERLPHYQGYEWRGVGPDAVLVDIITDNIHLVLEGVLD